MQVRCAPHLLHVNTATMSDRMFSGAPPVLYGRSQQPASPQIASLKERFCYKVLEVSFQTLFHLPPSACLQEPATCLTLEPCLRTPALFPHLLLILDFNNISPHTSTVSALAAYP